MWEAERDSRGEVEHIDQHQAEGDQQHYPGRHHVLGRHSVNIVVQSCSAITYLSFLEGAKRQKYSLIHSYTLEGAKRQKYYVIPSDRGDKEGDPAHHDEHGAGEVDGEDEGAEWPGQADLKPVHAVVAWRYELSDMSN